MNDELIPGKVVTLVQGLRRVVAPNPSAMTAEGTNTYLLGRDQLAVIDPGPESDAHLQVLRQAIGRATVSHIIVTHSHLDHSPLARRLATITGAPVLAFGTSDTGRSAVMQDMARRGLVGGGEGVDLDFTPDLTVTDGQVIATTDWQLEVIHTPGHMGNHISLGWQDSVFTGDHVMGWASSLVSPPDGDLTDFMASIERLQSRQSAIFYPAHGAPIDDPAGRLAWLRDHRLLRESQILAALKAGPRQLVALTLEIYTDIPAKMLPAAARNVLAHLIDLTGRGLVTPQPELAETAIFALTDQAIV